MIKLLAATALVLAALSSRGQAQVFTAEYVVSIFGITIARTQFESRLADGRYAIQGQISSSGLGAVFDNTKGTVSASGRLGENEALPDLYGLDYASGRKKQRTAVRFENRNAVATENDPPPKPRRHGWVPVEAADLVGVTDPLSATLVRASGLDEVCNRSVAIYDGEMRADLTLSLAARQPVASAAFTGEAVTCTVRFKPVSGYRKGSKTIEYLSAGHDMRVTFVPMQGADGYYVPLRGSVETRIGTVHFAVSRVGKVG